MKSPQGVVCRHSTRHIDPHLGIIGLSTFRCEHAGLPACQLNIGLSLVRSVHFTPTVQHCSMATLIGLSLRVKLMQTLPSRFKVCTNPRAHHHARRSYIHLAVDLQVNGCELSGAGTDCSGAGVMSCDWLQVDIAVAPGSHSTEAAVNKQLNDKERVAAALENPNLLEMVNNCLAGSYR